MAIENRLPIEDLRVRPYEVLAALRAQAAAVPVQSAGARYWVITRYRDVRQVLTDPTVVRDLVKYRDEINAHCIVGNDDRRARIPRGAHRSVFYQDGENHHRLRAAAAGYFAPSRLNKLAQVAEEAARASLDALRAGQTVDLVARYAVPIAAKVFCAIAGIPVTERNVLAAQATEIMMSSDRRRIESSADDLVSWAEELIDIKRGQPGDDLYKALLEFHSLHGMTKEELTSTYILFAVGSMEPVHSIGSGAYLFLTHPDQLASALRTPEWFADGADEIVRYETSFRFIAPRYTTAPLELDGVTVPAGELLLVALGGANHDPDFVDEPELFDIRRNPAGHVGFGHGIYRCLGAQLGKLETSTALRMLFERFPATSLVDSSGGAAWRSGKFFRRLEELPVVLA